jgi:hypothetical protein
MRLPAITSLFIEKFSAGVPTVKRSGSTNVIHVKRPDGTIYATQRPGINIIHDASGVPVLDNKGRGIYYWNAVTDTYFVNDDTVYKGSYSTALGTNISSGTERVEILECGDYLVFLDAENNEGWYINVSTPTTITAISDLDFPPNQTPALQIARGGVSLNKTLYVFCTNGQLYNCAVEDPTTWVGTDFIEAEINQDDGVFCHIHNQHIAAVGSRSTEYFYDAANVTGSPLNVREDIKSDIGAVDFDSFWNEADQLFFVGQTASGDIGVYTIVGFQTVKISNDDFDSMLTTAINIDNVKVVGSGFSSGGKPYYLLTLYYLDAGIVSAKYTYVFSDVIGNWELEHTGIDHFPLISWTQGEGSTAGQGILANGDIVSVLDDFTPTDTTELSAWVEDGWVEDGWVTVTEAAGENISIEMILGPVDLGTKQNKFCRSVKTVAEKTTNTQNLTVQWSDDSNNDYNTGRTIDLSNKQNRLNRCGRFITRNHKLSATPTEKVEIDSIEVEV